MAPGTAGNHDQARALDCLGDVGGNQVKVGPAGPLEAVLIALYAVQQNAGLVHVLQGGGCEGHRIVQANRTPGQSHIRCAGLADGAAAQNGNGHILQVFHLTHIGVLLLLCFLFFFCGCISFRFGCDIIQFVVDYIHFLLLI